MNLPELWQHQKGAIEAASLHPDLALFMEMGTGKSRTIVEILRMHFNRHKRYLKTLIVCPTAVVPNWRNEITKFSAIEAKHVHLLDDSLTLVERADAYISGPPGIYVVNFEAFAYPSFAEKVVKNPPEILIIDESHRVKGFDAKRTKAITKLAMGMEKLPLHHRYILTGSPVLNTQLDIFSQFQILDAGKTFGTNYYAFRATYFYSVPKKVSAQKTFLEWMPKPGIDEQLKALMAAKTVLAKKEQCLDLPPLVRVEIEVKMSKEQERAYKEMKKDFIAFVESGVGIAELALTKMLRMQQILSGFLKLDDDKIHYFKENPRADALEDLLTDLIPNQKVIVWSVFHADFEVIRKICDKLKIKYAEVTGLTKDKQKELDAFEKDPETRLMLASPGAGGTGVNMIAASAMIYFSKGYSLEHDLQSEARNYRGGSERHEKITRYDLVAKGTVDEVILTALREKKDLSTNILALRDLLSKI
jgi:SNF2 family DNA or RNA helicase